MRPTPERLSDDLDKAIDEESPADALESGSSASQRARIRLEDTLLKPDGCVLYVAHQRNTRAVAGGCNHWHLSPLMVDHSMKANEITDVPSAVKGLTSALALIVIIRRVAEEALVSFPVAKALVTKDLKRAEQSINAAIEWLKKVS